MDVQQIIALGIFLGLLVIMAGYLIYNETWYWWHPHHIRVVMRLQDGRKATFAIRPNRNKFVWKKRTYTFDPALCIKFGRTNSLEGYWNEATSGQVNLVTAIVDNSIASDELELEDRKRENRIFQFWAHPFAAGYISPMVTLVIVGLLVLVGTGIIYATIAPKVETINKHQDEIANFIGVPYAVTPTAVPTVAINESGGRTPNR